MAVDEESKSSYGQIIGLLEEIRRSSNLIDDSELSNDSEDALRSLLDILGDDQDLRSIDFPKLTLVGSKRNFLLLPNLKLNNSIITDAVFKNIELWEANFQYANLQGAKFTSCDLTDADFQYADLHNAEFDPCALWRANFQYANLHNVRFGSSGIGEADFRHADLRQAVFFSSLLTFNQTSFADFSHSDLRGAKFISCNIERAIFNDSDLRGAIFQGRVREKLPYLIDKSDFVNANLEGCTFVAYEDTPNSVLSSFVDQGAVVKLSNSLKNIIYRSYELKMYDNAAGDNAIAEDLVKQYKLHESTISEIKLAFQGEGINYKELDF